MDKKTHWRTIAGKEYLVGEELNNKEVTLTIKKVTIEELQNQKGKETKPVLSFVGTERKLVLNVTNMKAIAKELKTSFVEEWEGKKITLIPEHGKFFGVEQDVIRIKKNINSYIPNK